MLTPDIKPELWQALKTLLPSTDEAFAIAFSGGGDSTALLHALADHPQAQYAFIVDHSLRAEATLEAEQARDFAVKLGYRVDILTWKHFTRPRNGLQEKARQARYGLLGQACRDAGIKFLLTAHTENDQAETLFMRYERDTDWRGACGISASVYAPVWPELSGITVIRPLLHESRERLRQYNRAKKLSWSEDPSNQNMAFRRIQARAYLRTNPAMAKTLMEPAQDLNAGRHIENELMRDWCVAHLRVDNNGYVLTNAVPMSALLYYIIQAVSGLDIMPERQKVTALRRKLSNHDFKGATLSGVHVTREGKTYVFARDPVSVKGRGGKAPILQETQVNETPLFWDGRYKMTAQMRGVSVRPLYGVQAKLPSRFKAQIKSIPATARLAVPVLFQGEDVLAIGALDQDNIDVECLIESRLCGFMGVTVI